MPTTNPTTTSRRPGAHAAAGQAPAFLGADELRLLLFGGKGGVGKTTCAAAAALWLAERFPARNYLLVSTDPAHSLEDCLAGAVRPPNLRVRELDAAESLCRFKDAHAGDLRRIAERGTFLDDDDLDQFLDLSLPGLDEVMAFLELAALADDRSDVRVIVDTAPTGHTLRLLGMPDVLRKWLDALNAMLAKHRHLARLYGGGYRPDATDLFLAELGTGIEGLASLLTDPQRCCFAPVMHAEPLVTDETTRLVLALKRLNIPVRDLIVNAVCPPRADCPLCQETRRNQAKELGRIRAVFPNCRLWLVPLQAPGHAGVPSLTAFWDGAHEMGAAEWSRAAVDDAPHAARGPAPRVEHPAALPAPDTTLLLFAGKGGVGKTTLASATALRLAQEPGQRQILLLSLDPAHSLSDCLGQHIGPRAVRLNERLSALEIDAEREFADFRQQYAAEVEAFFARLSGPLGGLDVAFDREVVERLMDLSPPGIDEVMTLAQMTQLIETRAYDTFICDTAPTGHLVRLLELPALVEQWLSAFFAVLLKYKRVLRFPRVSELLITLSKRLKVLRALLTDPQKGSLHAVALPTELAFAETCDLLAACARARLHVPQLLVNMVRPAGDCALCAALVQRETAVRGRFDTLCAGVRPTIVYRGAPPRGLARLTELGRALYRT